MKRKEHGYGLVIDGREDPLTNLRFADDLLLVARSKADARRMLSDLQSTAAGYGLKVHLGKTKIITSLAHSCQHVKVGANMVANLQDGESVRYLGRKLTFFDYHGTEFRNRIACAWSAFAKYKGELCCRNIAASTRVKLFQTVVTPALLYGSVSWTMTQKLEEAVSVAQRRMLRLMFARMRLLQEQTYVDWIKEETARVETVFTQNGAQLWVQTCAERKYLFATKTWMHEFKWSSRLIRWQPIGHRCTGRPWTRWFDSIA